MTAGEMRSMVDLRSIAQPLNCAIFFVSVCSGLNKVHKKIWLSPNLLVHDLNWNSGLSRSWNDPRFKDLILDLILNQKMNIRMREEHTEKRRQWEDGGREWSKMFISQRTPRIANNHQKLEERERWSKIASSRNQPWDTLISEFWTMREWSSVILNCLVCGDSFQQP